MGVFNSNGYFITINLSLEDKHMQWTTKNEKVRNFFLMLKKTPKWLANTVLLGMFASVIGVFASLKPKAKDENNGDKK